MRHTYNVAFRNVARALLTAAAVAAAPATRSSEDPSPVTAKLSEWKVERSAATVPTGAVSFTISNTVTIPHAFEVEGRGVERETDVIQPGSTTTLTLTLAPGTYEVYCPVCDDSHKKLGMETHLTVLKPGIAGGSSAGYPEAAASGQSKPANVQSMRVTSGGPVIHILPGPFPFPDSAAPILQAFGPEREGLESQVKNGPHSNK